MRKTESAVRGQKIVTETSPDRGSHMADKAEHLSGRKMGGGPTDTSHSLGSAGSVQTYNDDAPKSRRS